MVMGIVDASSFLDWGKDEIHYNHQNGADVVTVEELLHQASPNRQDLLHVLAHVHQGDLQHPHFGVQ